MKSCLIVDDSVVIRKVIRQFLEKFGFSCTEAEDGSVAREICRRSMPFLVMLDWNMPVMGGMDFLRELRGMEGGEKPSVIFCTTENDINHIRQALEAGANDFIMKPFDEEIVRTKLVHNGLIEEAA